VKGYLHSHRREVGQSIKPERKAIIAKRVMITAVIMIRLVNFFEEMTAMGYFLLFEIKGKIK